MISISLADGTRLTSKPRALTCFPLHTPRKNSHVNVPLRVPVQLEKKFKNFHYKLIISCPVSLFLVSVFSASPLHSNEHATPCALTLTSANLFLPLSVLYETEGKGHSAGMPNTQNG